MDHYLCLANAMLDYTRENLTTKQVAKRLLRVTNHVDAKNILFLGGNSNVDYVRDMLLHGLKASVDIVVDFVRPAHLYDDNISNAAAAKGSTFNEGLYGLGYTYAHHLDFNDDLVDRHNIQSRILQKEFDLIIFGSVHRGMPFLEDVLRSYAKEDIVFVDGEDEHQSFAKTNILKHRGWYFKRELSELDDGNESGGCSILHR